MTCQNSACYTPAETPPSGPPCRHRSLALGQLLAIEKWAENLEEVTLSRWLKAEGEALAQGDSLCEIITDKVTFEYEIEQPAVLRKRYCEENSVLPVGYVMAFVGEEGEGLPEGVEERNRALLEQHQAKASLELSLDITPPGRREAQPARAPEGRVRATPAARRVARENGIAIEDIAAALGLEGVVSEADVAAFLAR